MVTVPPAGSPSELLWERFADVLGIPARDYGTALPRHNESLGVEFTEVVRRLNEVSRGAGFGKETHTRLFKHVVARGILAARRSQESRLALPPEQHDWARDTSREQVEVIAQREVTVVGDLEDLQAQIVPGDVTDPTQLDPERLLAASLDGIVGLLQERRELERKLADLERSQERLTEKVERNRATVAMQRRRLDALRAKVKVFEDRPLRAGVRTRARQVLKDPVERARLRRGRSTPPRPARAGLARRSGAEGQGACRRGRLRVAGLRDRPAGAERDERRVLHRVVVPQGKHRAASTAGRRHEVEVEPRRDPPLVLSEGDPESPHVDEGQDVLLRDEVTQPVEGDPVHPRQALDVADPRAAALVRLQPRAHLLDRGLEGLGRGRSLWMQTQTSESAASAE